MRRNPHQSHEDTQNRFQATMRNLGTIKPDFYNKEDFGFYLELYNQLPDKRYGSVMTRCNLYMKVMFTMAKTFPDVDLSTITKQDIYDHDYPCLSVKAAVDDGLFPIVKGYNRFNNPI